MIRHLLFAWALALPGWAGAHGGEDHGDAPAASAVVSAAPRFSSQTDQFELVGVLEGKVLRIYLDQYGSNAPVAKAQIEIERGAWKAVATEVAAAVYTLPAEALSQPGRHALAISVQAGDITDLMDATLEVGPAGTIGAATQNGHFLRAWAVWSGALALVLTALGLVVLRRRQTSRPRAHL